MRSWWRRVLSRDSGLLGVACLALGAGSCTEPSFSDPEKDATTDAVDGGDDAPPGRNDAAVEIDGGMGGDAAITGPAPQQDAASSPSDAGVPDSGAQGSADAGGDAAVQSALPAWAEGLQGTYAKRSVTFSYDESLLPSGGNTRNIEYSIVKITANGSVLDLSIQLCEFTVSAEGDPTLPVSFKHPTDLPPMTGRLVLEAPDSFSSEPMVQHLGFDPMRGNGCGASGRRDAFEDQTWITGATCQCSTSTLPTSFADCRVIDSDRDGKAGITAQGQYRLTPGVTDIAIVFDYAVTFVDGRVAANRRHELREVRAQAVSCVNASVDYCSVGNNELCPEHGSVRLIPLDAQATCADLDKGAFVPPDSFPIEVDCRAGR